MLDLSIRCLYNTLSMSTTAMLTIRTNKELKTKAQDLLKSLGLNLSVVVNAYLEELIRSRKVEFAIEQTPNAYIIQGLARRVVKQKFLTNPAAFRQLIWEYKMTAEEFFAILEGRKTKGWFTQDWAIARVLENVNYYDAKSLVPLDVLQRRWDTVRSKLFHPSLQKGYDLVLHQKALSAAK